MPITATEPVYLSSLSARDKVWDKHRAEADAFRTLFRGTVHDCYAIRIDNCCGYLEFAFQTAETGELKLKLQAARCCRVRQCPVCQWRKSLMWRAKAFKILPQVLEAYPRSRFIFLTLTVKNCPLEELRETLAWMNKGWMLLTKRKQFPALGWIKAVELTRADDDLAHPHFHCLLMVNEGYFSRGYLSQARWSELWKDCLKVDYTPRVDVRSIRPRKGTPEAEIGAAMISAVTETLKYSVKPSDVLKGENHRVDREWLCELTDQLKKTRSIATGGVLKEYLRHLESEPEDLIHADEDGLSEADDDSPRACFGWREQNKRYIAVD